ncbi:MAG TPA: ECF transporter S component [Pelolinea sp.]|nr:ECF transporter S component [Pelolinea sp.]
MEDKNTTRSIVITGLMAAIAVILGWTHWGFIPWFGGVALTIMHVPAIIAAVIVGPFSGTAVGLVFGIFSMIQAALAPTGSADVWFTNPLLAVLPRLFIGPAAWIAYRAFRRWSTAGLFVAGAIGSLTNTALVLGMIGLLGFLPWAAIGGIALANGLPELAASSIITAAVIAAYWRIPLGKRKGSNLD